MSSCIFLNSSCCLKGLYCTCASASPALAMSWFLESLVIISLAAGVVLHKFSQKKEIGLKLGYYYITACFL